MIKSSPRIDAAIKEYVSAKPATSEEARLKLLRAAWEAALHGDKLLELRVYMGFLFVRCFEIIRGGE